MPISDYNANPDLNISINGINIAEGCPPSGINNAIRQMMADIRDNYDNGGVNAHANTHKTGGSDPINPADIGAAPATHTTRAATASAIGHVKPGAGLSVDAAGALAVTYGAAANTACQGNDSRLTNARTPAAHAATHKTGGADALGPLDIGALAGSSRTPPAGSDLDASDMFWEPGGLWYCTATTTANRPDSVNGFCLVFGRAAFYVKQMFFRTSNTEVAAATYIRTRYYVDGAPSYTSPWERLYTSNDVIPITNGGTGNATGTAVNCSGNSATATKLAAARYIGLSGGATGTATLFDGSSPITIPVTELDVSKVTAGTLSLANGGTGNTTGTAASCSGNSATATKLAAARYIGLSGGATGTATLFDGSSPITIPVTALDVSKVTAGTLSLANGGTGAATAAAAVTSLGAAASARTITVSAPLTGGGDLAANRSIGINASSAATANYVIMRDASGRAQVAAPSAASDIARKADVDDVKLSVSMQYKLFTASGSFTVPRTCEYKVTLIPGGGGGGCGGGDFASGAYGGLGGSVGGNTTCDGTTATGGGGGGGGGSSGGGGGGGVGNTVTALKSWTAGAVVSFTVGAGGAGGNGSSGSAAGGSGTGSYGGKGGLAWQGGSGGGGGSTGSA